MWHGARGEVEHMDQSTSMQKKSMDAPDEQQTFDKWKYDLVKIGGSTFERVIFEPGFKWSVHAKPIFGTDSCQLPHLGYGISGRLKVVMDDGSEDELGPGEILSIPPGHDGWVIGDEPVVYLELAGAVHMSTLQQLGLAPQQQ
jgi:quercetin dioxygenase-like cupin family protein